MCVCFCVQVIVLQSDAIEVNRKVEELYEYEDVPMPHRYDASMCIGGVASIARMYTYARVYT